ncbi:MAG: tyrosine-type recombinase/integrase [Desulfobacteraceae bacterium]|nr:tyrosine-type recombinase/integrase [Desulfobacteraceae bacterium]MBC2720367.1 tyrosine-type recombinase/integrase [Desulfobacteraceae bacterium]
MAKKLAKAVDDYLVWMIDVGYASGTIENYENALNHFQKFITHRKIEWSDIFTHNTLTAFQIYSGLSHASMAVKGVSSYLYDRKIISSPIKKPLERLPEIYEDYLHYYEKTRQVHRSSLIQTRNVLSALNDYLAKQDIDLSAIKIEQIDSFLSEFNARFMPATCHHNRSFLRGFLRYLYFHRKILKRNLAALIVGAPMFAQAQPPKFLRSHEVKALFAGLSTGSCKELRTSAMVHLGYTLGLRPKEICLIRLNDISFAKREISLFDRKSANPIKLPLPEITIKAIAAYIVGCRPESNHRALFLTFNAPAKPVNAVTVSHDITVAIQKINPLSSAYWLRHTYAQNLLESGASIFEVKQMMGHDNVQSTKRYIHIHTKLMLKELFDETL